MTNAIANGTEVKIIDGQFKGYAGTIIKSYAQKTMLNPELITYYSISVNDAITRGDGSTEGMDLHFVKSDVFQVA